MFAGGKYIKREKNCLACSHKLIESTPSTVLKRKAPKDKMSFLAFKYHGLITKIEIYLDSVSEKKDREKLSGSEKHNFQPF